MNVYQLKGTRATVSGDSVSQNPSGVWEISSANGKTYSKTEPIFHDWLTRDILALNTMSKEELSSHFMLCLTQEIIALLAKTNNAEYFKTGVPLPSNPSGRGIDGNFPQRRDIFKRIVEIREDALSSPYKIGEAS